MRTSERSDTLKKKSGRLSKREKLFCMYYVNSADVSYSAEKAGYSKNFLEKGEQLLSKDGVQEEISQLCEHYEKVATNMARLGYTKLAFGSISDAVSLMYAQNPTKQQLNSMDLYMISEIKKPKDGAMEIKFFDRLKALEKLCLKQGDDHNATNGLIDALKIGAEKLSDEGDYIEV